MQEGIEFFFFITSFLHVPIKSDEYSSERTGSPPPPAPSACHKAPAASQPLPSFHTSSYRLLALLYTTLHKVQPLVF